MTFDFEQSPRLDLLATFDFEQSPRLDLSATFDFEQPPRLDLSATFGIDHAPRIDLLATFIFEQAQRLDLLATFGFDLYERSNPCHDVLHALESAKLCAKKVLDARCMHPVGNFVMDSGVEGKVHTYKILQCMPACAAGGRKLGRPRRIVVHAWTELDLAELTILRRLNDSKLRPNQLAEVDGDIVARGSGVLAGEDETAEVVAWDEGQNAANFAQTLVWDGYLRSVGAADELANQLKRAHDQILELSRQLSAETIAGQKRLNDLTAEHRTQMSNLASEHRSQVTAMTLEHNKQLGDMVDEMLKFKMSLLKNSGGSGATVDMETLTAVALKIADRIAARKD